MSRKATNRTGRVGFTLIEILVVVAIIALLISILLPSLRHAREQGRATVCGTHLSEIFTAVHMYTLENKDVLPHLGFRPGNLGVTYPWWVTQISKALSNQFEVFSCPSDKNPVQLHVCVDSKGRIHMNIRGSTRTTTLDVTYSGSCETLVSKTWIVDGSALQSDFPRKITEYKRPAVNLILVEGTDGEASDVGRCVRFSDMARLIRNVEGTAAGSTYRETWRRHNGRAHYLFMDGHVGRHTPEQFVDKMVYQQEYGGQTR